MFKINTHVVVWDKKFLENLKNIQYNDFVKNGFKKDADEILKLAKPTIPRSLKNTTHFADQYFVSEPKIYKVRLDGETYQSLKININPKGRYKVYYGVVTAGVRNGKNLNYTSPTATPYPIHNAVKKHQNQLQTNFINNLRKGVSKLNGGS